MTGGIITLGYFHQPVPEREFTWTHKMLQLHRPTHVTAIAAKTFLAWIGEGHCLASI